MPEVNAVFWPLRSKAKGDTLLSYDERIEVARSAVSYVTGRSEAELSIPVPNCPGWTVYNAAVHVGRACAFWEQMMGCTPDDTTARERALAMTEQLPTGVGTAELARWAHSAIDRMSGDPTRECYFSMTGGPGNNALWAWHAATELGVHRLDVEAALGHDHLISADEAADALFYGCDYFLPAMRRATGEDPGSLTAELISDGGDVMDVADIPSKSSQQVAVRGPAIEVLLAIFGRPHSCVEVTGGQANVWDDWQALPGKSHQFGTWE